MRTLRLLGLDVGTSGCKAVVLDAAWKVLASSRRRYDLVRLGRDGYELDAEEVWGKVREAIIEAQAASGGKLDAVAISALGDVIIALDGAGNPVRSCILDFDPRGTEEIREFAETFGVPRLYETTGMPPIHLNSLAKILWIRKHDPDAYRKVSRWATFEDFMLERLGAKPAASHSMAARTMLFDRRRKAWSQEVLGSAGLGERNLPETLPSGEVVSRLGGRIAEELGFAPGAAACSGAHDVVCAAIGAGLDVDDGRSALDVMGTMEVLIVLTKEARLGREASGQLYPSYPAWREYLSLSLMLASGSILDWYRDSFAGPVRTGGEGEAYGELLRGIDSGKPGELVLVPHFAGVCDQVFDPEARGAVYGLTLNSTPRDLAQGILDGLCFELRAHIQDFRDGGLPIGRLKVVGGGSNSDAWLQLKANVTGLELSCPDIHDASAIGAAALCGKALGLIDDPYAASALMGMPERRFVPEPEAVKRFDTGFSRYLSLREKVGVFERG